MQNITQRIDGLNWKAAADSLNNRGYALNENILTDSECSEIIGLYGERERFRKKVVMEKYGYGRGEYKYFDYPLPEIIQSIRQSVYRYLAPVANEWMEKVKLAIHFPENHQEFMAQCHENDQPKPTALILKYSEGGFNAMHQDLYGDVFFPMQLVLFLSETGVDYSGGEFVLLQQNPRAQSRAVVLSPKKGGMLIFTSNFRPEKGARGYRRLNMKHGVSEIISGERYTTGIIFHDAKS